MAALDKGHEYDVYNRVTTIRRYAWIGNTDVEIPAWKSVFAYDTAVNGWGRLASVSTYQHFADPSGATPIVEAYAYTTSGLVTQKSLTVTGVVGPLKTTYGWDNEGRPVSQKVEDIGPRFTWGYDGMGRLSTMTETDLNGNWLANLVTGVTYNAAGQMTQLVTPGGTENRTYNVLGQLTNQNGLGKNVDYVYSATANDGRITQRKDWLSGEEVNYLYDQLGRLSSAVTTGPEFGLSFSYDGFGNKTQQTLTKGTGPQHSYTVDAATNRLGGFGYDAAGNVISGLSGLPGTYSYDAENRLLDNNVESYGYGARNRRLWSLATASGAWAAVYLYGLRGEVLEVFGAQPYLNAGFKLERSSWNPTQRAWFGGRLIKVKSTSGGGWMASDRVGSYGETYPYGELRAWGTTSETFATYWRDAKGLDYAVNRYYSSQMGRFLTADPLLHSAKFAAPQSWNRYSYVTGDPVNKNDPSGLMEGGFCEAYPTSPECNHFGFPAGADDLEVIREGELSPGSPGPLKPFGYNGALQALAKKDCYEFFGFSSAAAAQDAFGKIEFKVSYLGYLRVNVFADGSKQVAAGTPPPAQVVGNAVDINYNYSWYDFASVEARNAATGAATSFDYLGAMNRELGLKMTTSDLSGLILLHEFKHTAVGGNSPQEGSNKSFNGSIFEKCVK